MKFKPGPDDRRGKGGKREGAGRKTNERKRIESRAQEIAQEFIERNIKPVLKSYLQLAGGRKVKDRNAETGKVLYTELEADSATTRHYIDKLIPAAKQTIDLNLDAPDAFYQAIQSARKAAASSQSGVK